VRAYGAEGNGESDDSAAFQKAVDDLAAAGTGVLFVPPGDYRFARRVSASVRQWSVAVVGAGQGVSNLYSDNSEGVFQFTYSERRSQMTVRDLSFFTGRSGGGAVLEVSQPERGNLHKRNLLVENVEMRGVSRTQGYFDYGIRSLNQWRPLFLNVIFAGPFGPGVSEEELFGATCGLQANGSYAPSFQNCYMWSVKTGYEVVTEEDARREAAPEDTAFYRSFAVECRVGMDIRTPAPEPQVEIDTCHLNCYDVGIRMRRKYFQITNCLLYGRVFRDREPLAYSDIELIGSFGGIITGNIFQQPTNPGRRMIDIDGDSYDIQIKENLFHATGTGIHIEPGASGIVCASNRFNTGPDPLLDRTSVDPVIMDPGRGAIFATDAHRGVLLRAAEQSIPDAEWASVEWGEVEYDTENLWTDAAADGGVVIPSNNGIHYVKLTAGVTWGEGGSGRRQVEFTKNGEGFAGSGRASEESPSAGSAESHEQNIQSAVIPVEEGDELRLRVRHTAGETLDVEAGLATWFAAEIVDA
jgi:hypothetical protein